MVVLNKLRRSNQYYIIKTLKGRMPYENYNSRTCKRNHPLYRHDAVIGCRGSAFGKGAEQQNSICDYGNGDFYFSDDFIVCGF